MSDRITIVGNIADDPTLVHTAAGVPIAKFRVASSQRRFDRSAQHWVDEEPNWFQVSAFRALGVHAHGSLKKGQRVIVTGRLRVRAWSAGDKRGTAVEVDADAVGHDLLFGTTAFSSAAVAVEVVPDRSRGEADGDDVDGGSWVTGCSHERSAAESAEWGDGGQGLDERRDEEGDLWMAPGTDVPVRAGAAAVGAGETAASA